MWKSSKISLNLLLIVICLNINIGFSKAATITKKQQVCVIGAGTSGLTSAKHLADYPDEFDIAVFERSSDIGGGWVYTDNTDVDEHGLPVHSSIYKNLISNSAREFFVFPDFKNFSDPKCRSAEPHERILSYLKNYTDHFNLRQYIQFNTLVEKVTPILGDGDWRSTKFLVKKRNLDTNKTSEITCDAVMVCNGNYFEPNIPRIFGIETFPGKVIHSHNYRRPEVYHGQTVAILGAAISGVDIAVDIAPHAKTIYLSHNKPKIEGSPDNIIQVAGVVGANGSELLLKDNSTIRADAFIFCTGYRYSFPFLDEDSGIKVDDNHITPLYKQLINVEHPKMSFLGLPTDTVFSTIVHFQSKFFVALLQGKVKLPNKSEMLLDSKVPKGRPKRYAHYLGLAQYAYYNDLARIAGFEALPPWYGEANKVWNEALVADPWHKKEVNIFISKNGDFFITEISKALTPFIREFESRVIEGKNLICLIKDIAGQATKLTT